MQRRASSAARTILSPEEFARAIGKSPKTVYRGLKKGAYPACQPTGKNGAWLIDFDEFRAGMKSGSADLGGEPPTQDLEASSTGSAIKPDLKHDIAASNEQISGPRPRWMRST